ncbi:hypothetical protein DOTSEDRAFT_160418 [Dothistroma septosporum NZE10]|uniref:Tim44-like domain-containing protein n=1 Tax=Dothistroma septosporum (strain NZE10 / CBS 128990) TaxID=675120 RepID=M2YIN4_DOTSN|nr:hypothetical protein DOTSEDRAFT_160418 [Dothistroma septosporum NZE10]
MGFLPNTFVPPSGKNLPSWFSNPRDRWKILTLKGWNWYYYLAGHFMAFWMVKPRVKLERGQLPRISKKLYEDMYSNFATGNLQAIENILSPGMLGSLRARIAQRTPNTGLKWTVHKYLTTPKVISYKFQVLPDGPNTDKFAFAQAVVRIQSLQSLTKTKRMRVVDRESNKACIKEATVDEQGSFVHDGDLKSYRQRVARVTTEYLVVQRMVRHSRLGEWHVWGTTEEATMREIRGKGRQDEDELMNKV